MSEVCHREEGSQWGKQTLQGANSLRWAFMIGLGRQTGGSNGEAWKTAGAHRMDMTGDQSYLLRGGLLRGGDDRSKQKKRITAI